MTTRQLIASILSGFIMGLGFLFILYSIWIGMKNGYFEVISCEIDLTRCGIQKHLNY